MTQRADTTPTPARSSPGAADPPGRAPRQAPSTPAPAGSPASLSRVVLPTEHGGWAFLAEPILLGLLVAPSWAGALIATATAAAFVARTPFKLAVMDRRRGRTYPRTILAGRAAATLAAVAAAAFAGAIALGDGRMLLAVVPASLLAALALSFDLARRTREAAAEMAAALALAGVAPVIALAAGWPALQAFGLWGILAARIVPTVLYVRARLRLDRGAPANAAGAHAAHLVALAWAAGLHRLGAVPWPGVAAVALLAARAAVGLSPWRPRMTTMQLGLGEIAFGILLVAAVALGRVFGP